MDEHNETRSSFKRSISIVVDLETKSVRIAKKVRPTIEEPSSSRTLNANAAGSFSRRLDWCFGAGDRAVLPLLLDATPTFLDA
jgi:hypothetical protein